ncbi:MAG: hypothetical protein AAGC55_00435 [Myxococcota bacterium]
MLAAVALGLAGCAGGSGRFPAEPPMWRDHGDFMPFSPMPAVYRSPRVADAVDNSLFGPIDRFLGVDTAARAVNVNAVDEVPDSSWFENRMGRLAGRAEMLRRGPCVAGAAEPMRDPRGPWTVVAGKPGGSTPGFTIRDETGQRYLIKLDRRSTGERPSSGDVIGSLIYHAAGFNVPCNRVALFSRDILRIAPGATAEDDIGDPYPLTPAVIDQTLARALRLSDGRYRAVASKLIAGEPLGAWVDFGVRPDDPNDVVPHQDRRELRGTYLLAAMLDHYDAREQNTLDVWVPVDRRSGTGWVKHYFIDFGDAFGTLSRRSRTARRRGVVHELDLGLFFSELFTLGVRAQPWQERRLGPAGAVLGYYNVRDFDPETWSTGYPFGPFARRTEGDLAWMARILARLSHRDLRVIIDQAIIADPVMRAELTRVLLGRRDMLLRRYLGRLSPLADPFVRDGRLCLRDLAVSAGVAEGAVEVCTPLPEPAPDYHVVTIRVRATAAIRVHLRGQVVVGLER